ncbi:MAG: GNAT family N-acetyltransferase [Muricauda sp.]|nr:GNAT family N-acetyltransferase [uncultured Allomuricauda sp.]MBC74272.1 GNAT family N-acetyltransferase [Allomuricauda sp.]|tara:strand:- start:3206 stop:3763 length:558 start_codon:yes stop_codon:yes gene_type:complete
MTIRRARKEDSKVIANILLLAMDTIIYKFIGEDSMDKASCFLAGLVRKEANQYSYENCWVAVSGEEITGVVNVYEGADFLRLRTPVLDEISKWSQKDLTPEIETEKGELYIDSLGVIPKLQGKGIGSNLLKYLITEYAIKDKKTLGLLVDLDNTGAGKLYHRLGFVKVGEKLLCGKKMEHLQLKC